MAPTQKLRFDLSIPVWPIVLLIGTGLVGYGVITSEFEQMQQELVEFSSRITTVEDMTGQMAVQNGRLDRLELAGSDREARLRGLELGMARQDEKLLNILNGIKSLNDSIERVKQQLGVIP